MDWAHRWDFLVNDVALLSSCPSIEWSLSVLFGGTSAHLLPPDLEENRDEAVTIPRTAPDSKCAKQRELWSVGSETEDQHRLGEARRREEVRWSHSEVKSSKLLSAEASVLHRENCVLCCVGGRGCWLSSDLR
jgi:hypothetical protein